MATMKWISFRTRRFRNVRNETCYRVGTICQVWIARQPLISFCSLWWIRAAHRLIIIGGRLRLLLSRTVISTSRYIQHSGMFRNNSYDQDQQVWRYMYTISLVYYIQYVLWDGCNSERESYIELDYSSSAKQSIGRPCFFPRRSLICVWPAAPHFNAISSSS